MVTPLICIFIAYLVQFENCFDAFMHELGLLLKTPAVQCHQLLVEVHAEEVEVVLEVNVLRFSQRDGADGADWRGEDSSLYKTPQNSFPLRSERPYFVLLCCFLSLRQGFSVWP